MAISNDTNSATEGSGAVSGNVLTNDTVAGSKKVTAIVFGNTTYPVIVGVAKSIIGNYGTLVINSNGTYTYTLDETKASVQALAAGQHVPEMFEYIVNGTNSLHATLNITVYGTNDAPTIGTATTVGSVTEDTAVNHAGKLTAGGTINFADKDLVDVHSVSITSPTTGFLGTFTSTVTNDSTTDGSGVVTWSFLVANSAVQSLAAGQTLTQVYTLEIADNHGGVVSKNVTVTLTGTNDVPVINAATSTVAGAIVEDGATTAATGNIRFDDADLTDAHTVSVISSTAGFLGTFTPIITDVATGVGGGAVTWNYSVNNSALQYLADGQTKIQIYTVQVSDGHGGLVTKNVTITLTGTNDAPTINTATSTDSAAITEGGAVTAVGSLNFDDLDLTDTHTVSVVSSTTGFLGTFTPTITDVATGAGGGTVTWGYSISNSVIQHLAAGQTLTQVYTVKIADNHGGVVLKDVTITLTGTNDAPTVNSVTSVLSGSVVEDAAMTTATGIIHFADLDTIDTHSILVTPAADGYLGTFTPTLTDGNGSGSVAWDYAVDNGTLQSLAAGQTLTQTYTVQIADNNGGVVSKNVTITLTGTNDVPSINVETAMVAGDIAEDGTTTATGTIHLADVDLVDTHAVSVTSSTTGFLGTFTPSITTDATGGNDGVVTWEYAVDNAALQHLATGQVVTQTYTLKIADNHGGFVTKDVTITITGTNDGPTAVADSASTNEGASVTFGVLGNDTDPDTTDSLSVTEASITNGASGSVVVNADNTLTYDPGSAYNGLAAGETATVEITYTISDGHGGTSSAVATVTVTGTNEAPTIDVDTATVSGAVIEDAGATTASGTLHFSDVDLTDTHSVSAIPSADGYLGTLTPSISTTATGGNVGEVIWNYAVDNATLQHLTAGQTLTQIYTVQVADNHGGSVSKDVTITLTGSNDTPVVAEALTSSVNEGGSSSTVNLLSGASDIDTGETATLTVGSVSYAVDGGTASDTAPAGISLDGSTLTVDPSNPAFDHLAEGATQTIAVGYDVTDVHGATVHQTATITVTGVNDAPNVAEVLTSSVKEGDSSSTINLLSGASDIDTGETATLTVGALSYTVDGGTASDTAPAGISLDGSTLTVDPSNPAFDHLAAGTTQTIAVGYDVTDVHGATVHQTATVTVTGINDAPVATDKAEAVLEGAEVINGTVVASDVDQGAALTYTLTGNAPAGLTFNANGSYSFDPSHAAYDHLALGVPEVVTVTYKANDGTVDSNESTLSITLTGTNDAPVVEDINATVSEDGSAVTLAAPYTDVDTGDTHTVTFDTGSTLGNVSENGNGSFSYDPNGQFDYLAAGETGTDTFSYTIDDGNGGVVTKTALLTIEGVNDSATISGIYTGLVTEDVGVLNGNLFTSNHLAVTDLDNGQEAFVPQANILGSHGYGAFSLTGSGDWAYTANNNQAAIQHLGVGESLTDSFTATSLDGTASQVVTVTINGANDAPTIPTFALTAPGDALVANSIVGHYASTDADASDSLTYSGGSGGANPLLSVLNNGDLQLNVIPATVQNNITVTSSVNDGHMSVSAASFKAVVGTNGVDVVRGTGTADYIFAGDGSDTITGGNGADVIYGQGGNDTLNGQAGSDTLTGGSGSDTFVFNTALNLTGIDTIADFVSGTDKIQFSKAIFGALTVGSSAAFDTSLASGHANLVYDNTSGKLYYDANGATHGHADAVEIAVLGMHPTLANTDFMVV